ncbi:hypothetical protein BDF19DRAFT_9251 [Syncephalis fuscata]|nr:hypothetical protein BDF19DRAFT_9251 [Syncephalis fuscata]
MGPLLRLIAPALLLPLPLPFLNDLAYKISYIRFIGHSLVFILGNLATLTFIRAHLPWKHWAAGWGPSLWVALPCTTLLLIDRVLWLLSLTRMEQHSFMAEPGPIGLWAPTFIAESIHWSVYGLIRVTIILSASFVIYARSPAIISVASTAPVNHSGNTQPIDVQSKKSFASSSAVAAIYRRVWTRHLQHNLCINVIILHTIMMMSVSLGLLACHSWIIASVSHHLNDTLDVLLLSWCCYHTPIPTSRSGNTTITTTVDCTHCHHCHSVPTVDSTNSIPCCERCMQERGHCALVHHHLYPRHEGTIEPILPGNMTEC